MTWSLHYPFLARFRCSTGTNLALYSIRSPHRSSATYSWLPAAIRDGWRMHTKVGTDARSTRRDSLHCRLGRCYSHTLMSNETTHLLLSFSPFPLLFFLSCLKRESMQSKDSYNAMSLTVGDCGRLRSLSTETLQHMRSFLKEWPQNPHWFGLMGAFLNPNNRTTLSQHSRVRQHSVASQPFSTGSQQPSKRRKGTVCRTNYAKTRHLEWSPLSLPLSLTPSLRLSSSCPPTVIRVHGTLLFRHSRQRKDVTMCS